MEKPKTTAKDFFFYFWITVSLYMSVVSLIALLFAVIDHAFPGLYASTDTYSAGVRTAIATLVVIFPVFILMSRYVYRTETADPSKRELGMRKWLTYINLFVGGLTLIIDLIVLLNKFLGGTDFTTGFFLKVIAVFVVVGSVFWYYIYDLKHPPAEAGSVPQTAMYGAVAFVIAALIVGFVVMGSPVTQRMKQYDETRVYNLTDINSQVIEYWRYKKELPQTLDELANTATGYMPEVKDPETGEMYMYEVDGPLIYKLCATFDLDNTATTTAITRPAPIGKVADSWAHGAGDVCFTRTIDPQLYPPVK